MIIYVVCFSDDFKGTKLYNLVPETNLDSYLSLYSESVCIVGERDFGGSF